MFARSNEQAIPVIPVTRDELGDWLSAATERERNWVKASAFVGEAGSHVVLPDADGRPACVLVGHDGVERSWVLAGLPGQVPSGDYFLDADWPESEVMRAAIGWGLACHRFDRYKAMPAVEAALYLPESIRRETEILVNASTRVRALVNTPAVDLGPAELANVTRSLAEAHGAEFRLYEGKELEEGFPAVQAVGQAASRPPCLARLQWGRPDDPPLALVGKGVIFDSGGLNIKPGSGMVLMKKDMGGAAHVLGLAEIIMALGLRVNLRVYIPAVENAIAGNALRPSDIIRTRNGTSVEIGNTDAEGRVILSDALTLACEEGAERILDFATLTGAARIALGEDLPPVYGRSAERVRNLQDLSFNEEDPLWHMPLFEPYRTQIQPALADLSNTGTTPQGGSITAALFLDHFVDASVDWYHFDVYAWNLGDRPGRPAGGEAQGIRSVWNWLRTLYEGA